MRLANKVAIITGASSGIGKASACLFAREGAKIVVADIDDSGGADTVDTIKSGGGEAAFVHVDISKASEVENLARVSKEKFGRIDILYNDVGIGAPQVPFEEIEESVWEHIYAVNVKGTFLVLKNVVPEMKKAAGGVIINTASMLGIRPKPNVATYASSKGAIIALTKAVALELAPYNIRVNCICPMLTLTPMIKNITEEQRKKTASATPLGRLAKPEDMAYAALYLASDESSMLTGTIMTVDGGSGI
jgi:3-oxoacyl-[acyl-carrier protein] reductase